MNHKRISQLCLVGLLVCKVCVYAQQNGYYLDETETRLPENLQISSHAAMGDVDLDGDMDIVVANNPFGPGYSGQNELLINDGSGYFTDETDLRLPVWNDETDGGIALFDIDGDGDLDYMAANSFGGGAENGHNQLYLNDGTGHFEKPSSYRIPKNDDPTMAIAFGDVDGDSDLDMFWANYPANRLLLNDGAGYSTDVSSTHLEPDTVWGRDAVFGDVDLDGDLDLLIARFDSLDNKPNYLYMNDGTGHFTGEGEARLPAIHDGSLGSLACTFADIDGDGDLDVLFSNVTTLVLLLNDGLGYYTDISAESLPTVQVGGSRNGEFLDADLDGDLDLFVSVRAAGRPGGQNLLYMNDGAGYFTDATESWLPQQTEVCDGIAVGDVDGDEDIDIFLACDGYLQNHLFINYLMPVGVEERMVDIPEESWLLPNYPNPFNRETGIAYKVGSQGSTVKLSIYTVLGQEIITLVDEVRNQGVYEVIWDGQNKFGERVSSGVYVYGIQAQPVGARKPFVQVRKLAFLR